MSRLLDCNVEKKILVERIFQSFSDIQHPSLDSLFINRSSMIEYNELLGNEYWAHTDFFNIRHRDDILASLSPIGFIYYLPGLLLFILNSYSDIDVLGEAVAYKLTPPLDSLNQPRDSWKRNYFDSLSLQQRCCVRDVMLFVLENHNEGLFDDALERFWLEEPA